MVDTRKVVSGGGGGLVKENLICRKFAHNISKMPHQLAVRLDML